MKPHPTLRIVWLLALAATLPAADIEARLLLIACTALLASRVQALAALTRAVWRIRWLLLSLGVVYLWFPPDRAPGLAPQAEGLVRGAQQIAYLTSLVIMVELVRRTTPTRELAAALVALLAPLARLGVAVDAFARRLALTLELVSDSAQRVRAALAEEAGDGRLARWSGTAARLVAAVERDAHRAPSLATLPALRPFAMRDALWACLAVGTLIVLVSV